ncbi:uncharacterized protein BDZ99DRAFT_464360 [Mytilinidion resinicola]|uniref:Uncharacterized protein n=1 Tax=Mytilinidion resinicola TaxID=574789 RepID=A0A6A6YI65_9PEZI|nr:uncharacterized protein BDZ99DRAFT_464360 [Mytilinidion resinicola]KAF2808491.1 hypothetical protein BDZ99DRAFT_464360 [Mytilinidion resinicola]
MSTPIKKPTPTTPSAKSTTAPPCPPRPPKPPPILLHKSASSSAYYDRLIAHYSARGHPCYAPDMPGFGNSFDPSAADVAAIHARGTGRGGGRAPRAHRGPGRGRRP